MLAELGGAMRRAILFGLVGLALAWPGSARADSNFAWDNYCINDAFVVCASVRINVTTAGHLTMQVWNLEGTYGSAHTITSIGLYHVGDWSGIGEYKSATYVNGGSTDITDKWSDAPASIKTLGGVDLQLSTGAQGSSGINGCTALPGGTKWLTCNSFPGAPYVEFGFDLEDWSDAYSASDFELRWHSQQLPDGSSLKCDTGGYGSYGPCTPPSTVPEPFTMTLLASGLAGMGGLGFLRRRPKA
jgi:hypothetical protein